MKQLSTDLLMKKIDLVVDSLMHLGSAEYDKDKGANLSETKLGNIQRDFGIEEWDWPQGVGLLGLIELETYYGDDRYDGFIESWLQNNFRIGLPSKNINTTMPYFIMLNHALRTGNEKYIEMCRERAEWLIHELPRTNMNGFQHVTSGIGDRNAVILNEQQLWVDTLFMSILFLSLMGEVDNNNVYRDECIRQYLIHMKYLQEKQKGLFYHGWSFERNDNFGGIFWCRGNSWFTLGAPIFLKIANKMQSGVRSFIANALKEQIMVLSELQSANGLWHTVLDDSSTYEEVSGSAAIAAGIYKAVDLGIVEEKFISVADKAIAGICSYIDEQGLVGQVSAGTGIGMDRDFYQNIIVRPMAYGQSLTLIALVEAIKHIAKH